MSTNQIKVMVVEDEILIGLMLVKKLRAHGFQVGEVVTTGEEAVDLAMAQRPSVILMDVTLAGQMDGLEAAEIIQRRSNTPILIFTGYNDSLVNGRTAHIKPAAVLTKMTPIAEIVEAITRAAKLS